MFESRMTEVPMCGVCDGKSMEEQNAETARRVREHGWTTIYVEGADERNPSFGYTVGLSSWSHPELIMFHEHPQCTGRLLAWFAKRVIDGHRFTAGDDIPGSPEPVELLPFPDSTTHLYIANDYYGSEGAPVSALQIVVPRLSELFNLRIPPLPP